MSGSPEPDQGKDSQPRTIARVMLRQFDIPIPEVTINAAGRHVCVVGGVERSPLQRILLARLPFEIEDASGTGSIRVNRHAHYRSELPNVLLPAGPIDGLQFRLANSGPDGVLDIAETSAIPLVLDVDVSGISQRQEAEMLSTRLLFRDRVLTGVPQIDKKIGRSEDPRFDWYTHRWHCAWTEPKHPAFIESDWERELMEAEDGLERTGKVSPVQTPDPLFRFQTRVPSVALFPPDSRVLEDIVIELFSSR